MWVCLACTIMFYSLAAGRLHVSYAERERMGNALGTNQVSAGTQIKTLCMCVYLRRPLNLWPLNVRSLQMGLLRVVSSSHIYFRTRRPMFALRRHLKKHPNKSTIDSVSTGWTFWKQTITVFCNLRRFFSHLHLWTRALHRCHKGPQNWTF